ncbi:MAG: PIN domain-containing protein [Armatimonadota bacterium]|nr:PIN domain-containing protein [bacterium]MDW8322097.1 PIN domain-containing protein [Armatimonadota bacterium]
MQLLIDTSVLVRLRDKGSPHLVECERAIDLLIVRDEKLYLCTQVLIEFWSVATRPLEANGLGRNAEQAFLDCQLFLGVMSLLDEPPDIARYWLELVRRYEVKGKEVHDARLVAFALAHGIPHILTLNPADFSRYQEVAAITPANLVEQLS